MVDILPFRPRPKSPAKPMIARQQRVTVPAPTWRRPHTPPSTRPKLIAILDRIDGDPDLEDGRDDEPSLGAPEEHGNTIVWVPGDCA